MRSLPIRAVIGAAALALAAGTLFSGPVAAEAPPIKIGSFLSVTGPAAFLGDPEEKTLKLYVEKLNAAGGVIGRKIELVVYDDQSSATTTPAIYAKLLDVDKVTCCSRRTRPCRPDRSCRSSSSAICC